MLFLRIRCNQYSFSVTLRFSTHEFEKKLYTKKCDTLQQMACDSCVDFNYLKKWLYKSLNTLHNCKNKSYDNYIEEMGDGCNCDDCNECIIINYKIHQIINY